MKNKDTQIRETMRLNIIAKRKELKALNNTYFFKVLINLSTLSNAVLKSSIE